MLERIRPSVTELFWWLILGAIKVLYSNPLKRPRTTGRMNSTLYLLTLNSERCKMNRSIGVHITFTLGLLLAAGTITPALAEQELIPLEMAISPPSANRVAFIIAYEEGIYEKNGLDVDHYISPQTAEAMARDGMIVNPEYIRAGAPTPLATGTGTNAIVGPTTSASGPQDIVILATLDGVMRGHIVAQPEITSLEQLKGKRLGYTVPGGRTHFVALVVAEKMGWDPVQDISLISDSRMDALKSGRVDAIIANENRLAEARAAGYEPLVDLSTWDVPIASTGITATRSWLADNQEPTRRFIKSLVEANALLKKDKDVSLRAMEKWWGIKDKEKQDLFYAGAADVPRKPYPSVNGIKKVMEVYDSNEMRKHEPEDFYDDSFIRELDESGYIDSLYE